MAFLLLLLLVQKQSCPKTIEEALRDFLTFIKQIKNYEQ